MDLKTVSNHTSAMDEIRTKKKTKMSKKRHIAEVADTSSMDHKKKKRGHIAEVADTSSMDHKKKKRGHIAEVADTSSMDHKRKKRRNKHKTSHHATTQPQPDDLLEDDDQDTVPPPTVALLEGDVQDTVPPPTDILLSLETLIETSAIENMTPILDCAILTTEDALLQLMNQEDLSATTEDDEMEANIIAMPERPPSPDPIHTSEEPVDACPIPVVTDDCILAEIQAQPRPDRQTNTKRAVKGLACQRLIASIQYCNPDWILFNDRPNLRWFSEPVCRRFNIDELLNFHTSTKPMLAHTSYINLPDVKSLQYASFLEYPHLWVNTATDKTYDQLMEEQMLFDNGIAAADMLTKGIYLSYKTTNTRVVEQDTNFPDISRSSTDLPFPHACVVVGNPNVIAMALDGSLSYSESCDRSYRSVLGLKQDDKRDITKTTYKRSSDFPVLAALDTKQLVEVEGKVYQANFMDKTTELGCTLIPLLATSCTEAMIRIQVTLLNQLYMCGQVMLNPNPIDKQGRFYKLSDDDQASQLMNFHRSDAVMYQVNIHCKVCGVLHNNLWEPNLESELLGKVMGAECRQCKTTTVVNSSCFVMRETNCRMSLDPGSSRKINYEVPKRKGETRLPEDTTDVADLQQYEYIYSSASAIKLDIQEDLGRKNQRTTSIAVTLFLPTAYSEEKTMAMLREQFQEAGIDVSEIQQIGPDPKHVVDIYCYHEGREHKLQVVRTRVKLSLSCNKTLDTDIHADQLKSVKYLFGNLKSCVVRDGQTVKVYLPSKQTSKRFGVKTHGMDGATLQHESEILLAPSGRKQSKKQSNEKFIETGPLMSSANFWCKPDWKKSHNFLRFGQSVLGGLVNNLYMQGTTTVQGQTVELLQRGDFKWSDLEVIEGVLSKPILEKLWNKKTHEIREEMTRKDDEIESMKTLLEVQKQKQTLQNSTRPDVENLQRTIEDLKDKLQKVTDERDLLKKEKDNLDRELRALKRSYTALQEEHDQLYQRVNVHERERLIMHDEICGLKDANKYMMEQSDRMEKSLSQYSSMMQSHVQSTLVKDWTMDIDRQSIPVF